MLVAGAFYDVTPQGDAGNVRQDYMNGINSDNGLLYTLRTFNQDSSLTTGPGWDNVTGVGSVHLQEPEVAAETTELESDRGRPFRAPPAFPPGLCGNAVRMSDRDTDTDDDEPDARETGAAEDQPLPGPPAPPDPEPDR